MVRLFGPPIIWISLVAIIMTIITVLCIILKLGIVSKSDIDEILSSKFRAVSEILTISFIISLVIVLISSSLTIIGLYNNIRREVTLAVCAVMIFLSFLLIGLLYFGYNTYKQLVLEVKYDGIFGATVILAALSVVLVLLYGLSNIN